MEVVEATASRQSQFEWQPPPSPLFRLRDAIATTLTSSLTFIRLTGCAAAKNLRHPSLTGTFAAAIDALRGFVGCLATVSPTATDFDATTGLPPPPSPSASAAASTNPLPVKAAAAGSFVRAAVRRIGACTDPAHLRLRPEELRADLAACVHMYRRRWTAADVRFRYAVVDVFLNFVVLTPLCALFWYGGAALADRLVLEGARRRATATEWYRLPAAAAFVVAVGSAVQFAAVYWQEELVERRRRDVDPLGGLASSVAARVYVFVVAVGGVWHRRGLEELYRFGVGVGGGGGGVEGGAADGKDLRAALMTAGVTMVLLWLMKAGRNVISVPLLVRIDVDDVEKDGAGGVCGSGKCDGCGWLRLTTIYRTSVSDAACVSL